MGTEKLYVWVKGLTNAQLCVLVAQHSGWVLHRQQQGTDVMMYTYSHPRFRPITKQSDWYDTQEGAESSLPCYTQDRNSMADVEHYLFELPDGYAQSYVTHLGHLARRGWEHAIDACTFASARDRARAYAVTLVQKEPT